MNVFVEQFPNEDIREFHLSQPVTAKPFSRYGSGPTPKKVQRLERKLERLPQIGEGSTSGMVGHKVIRFERNKAYSWDEAIAAVHSALKQFYRVDDLPMVIGERDPEWDRPRDSRRDEWDY